MDRVRNDGNYEPDIAMWTLRNTVPFRVFALAFGSPRLREKGSDFLEDLVSKWPGRSLCLGGSRALRGNGSGGRRGAILQRSNGGLGRRRPGAGKGTHQHDDHQGQAASTHGATLIV